MKCLAARKRYGRSEGETSRFLVANTAETAVSSSSHSIVKTLSATRSIVFLWIVAAILAGAAAWLYFDARDRQIGFVTEMHKKLSVAPLFPPDKRPEGAVANPSFSPDGKYIAYNLMNDGGSMIFVKILNAGDPVRISDGRSFDRTPFNSSKKFVNTVC
jgi:hypothetical protein